MNEHRIFSQRAASARWLRIISWTINKIYLFVNTTFSRCSMLNSDYFENISSSSLTIKQQLTRNKLIKSEAVVLRTTGKVSQGNRWILLSKTGEFTRRFHRRKTRLLKERSCLVLLVRILVCIDSYYRYKRRLSWTQIAINKQKECNVT